MQKSQTILEMNNRVRGVRFPEFQVHRNATVIKTVWFGTINRSPHTYNKLIYFHELTFDKDARIIHWEKRQSCVYFFQQIVLRQLDIYIENTDIGALPHIIHKINSKWIKYKPSRKCKSNQHNWKNSAGNVAQWYSSCLA